MSLLYKFEPHACANCGELHVCTGNYHCWCTKLEIPEKVQDYISASFDGCLCEKCIEKLCKEYHCDFKNSNLKITENEQNSIEN